MMRRELTYLTAAGFTSPSEVEDYEDSLRSAWGLNNITNGYLFIDRVEYAALFRIEGCVDPEAWTGPPRKPRPRSWSIAGMAGDVQQTLVYLIYPHVALLRRFETQKWSPLMHERRLWRGLQFFLPRGVLAFGFMISDKKFFDGLPDDSHLQS